MAADRAQTREGQLIRVHNSGGATTSHVNGMKNHPVESQENTPAYLILDTLDLAGEGGPHRAREAL